MAYFFVVIGFFILFIITIVVLMGVTILSRLLGGLRNLWAIITGKSTNSQHGGGYRGGYARTNTSGSYQGSNTSSASSSKENNTNSQSYDQSNRSHSKGVFADDEGTYVDFEEVKD